MHHQRCAPQAYRSLAIVGAFLCLLLLAFYARRDDVIPFFMTRPSINMAILVLGVAGFLLCLADLLRVLAQSRALDCISTVLATRDSESLDSVRQIVDRAPTGLVKNRSTRTIAMVGHGGDVSAESLGMLADADAQTEEGRGLMVRYILGVMVFLGLIGTFWGVLITVRGVQEVLQALDPTRVDDPISFIAQLKSSIGDMLGGLSTAFSTSLFGLGGSVILGFVEVQVRGVRSGLLAELDRFAVSDLMPRIRTAAGPVVKTKAPTSPGDARGDEFYLVATHQALAENLRQLTEVIGLQTTIDEKITNSLLEIRGMLETLREEELRDRESVQLANQMRQSLLDRMDNAGRHLERLVKETRLTRESSEQMGKTLLDRMKLEGEITNRTLSIGFADLGRCLETVREDSGKREES